MTSVTFSGGRDGDRFLPHVHHFCTVTTPDSLCFAAACHVSRVVLSRVQASVAAGSPRSGSYRSVRRSSGLLWKIPAWISLVPHDRKAVKNQARFFWSGPPTPPPAA